jgi:hypothetical protein
MSLALQGRVLLVVNERCLVCCLAFLGCAVCSMCNPVLNNRRLKLGRVRTTCNSGRVCHGPGIVAPVFCTNSSIMECWIAINRALNHLFFVGVSRIA